MRAADLPAVGKLAGMLVRAHHRTDPERFMRIPNVEEGYAWYFGTQLKNRKAVLRVAERKQRLIGYAYGSLEPRDWNSLLDKHGAIHDILVAPGARKSGVGRSLMEEMLRALTDAGAERVVLQTMVQNATAQRLFRAVGFRPTMFEMTWNRR